MNFEPIRTKADLETLDHAEIVAGYMETRRGDPEPGTNRGRAYWHGWCNRMRDFGELPMTAASAQLAKELVAERFVVGPSWH